MRFSSSVSYALGILLQVQRQGAGSPVTAARIAAGCKFPPRFLYRVLRRLVDAGLLTGVSGPGGGYRLARRPRSINLLDIISAVEGPQKVEKLTIICPKHRKAVSAANQAAERVARRSRQELSKVKLADLFHRL